MIKQILLKHKFDVLNERFLVVESSWLMLYFCVESFREDWFKMFRNIYWEMKVHRCGSLWGFWVLLRAQNPLTFISSIKRVSGQCVPSIWVQTSQTNSSQRNRTSQRKKHGGEEETASSLNFRSTDKSMVLLSIRTAWLENSCAAIALNINMYAHIITNKDKNLRCFLFKRDSEK